MSRDGLLLFYYIDVNEPYIIPCEEGILRHKESAIVFDKKDGGSSRVIADKNEVSLILIHWYQDRCILIDKVLPSFKAYFIENNYTYSKDVIIDVTYIQDDSIEYEIIKQ